MLPLRDCRGYRSRYINALNRAVRSLTPIAGRGIRLRQSAQGVVIEATAKSAAGVPFDHRFKVSFAANADGGFDLTIRKGSLWRVAGGIAAEQTLLLGSGIAQHPTDADAWQIASASAGSLYVSQSTAEDGETPVYMLVYAAIPVAPLAVIAEFTPSQSSSNPTPRVTQRHLGDLLIFEGGEGAEVPPAAWCVRKNTVTETTSSGETTEERWQIFAPTWTVGRDTLLPAGMGRGWNDLPDGLASGTLYAALTWTGTATVDDEGNETVSWTPGTPVITNDASTIPPDDDPTGAGTSSATPGHRSVIVEIGEFSGEGDAFDQRHVGSIVEDINISASAPAAGDEFDHPFKVTIDDNGALHVAHGNIWERVANYSGGNKLKKIDKIWVGQVGITEEDGGWKIENPKSGILYIGVDLNWSYNLFLNASANECTNVCTIAEITVASSGTTIKQCQIGDAIVDGYSSLPWLLRPSYNDINWRIEAPYWIIGRERLELTNTIIALEDGDHIYAYLTWTGTTTADSDGNTSEEWEHGSVSVTKDLSTIPADAPADRYGNGRRTIVVPIGFLRDGHFLQEHIGAIIADISTTQSAPAPAPTEADTLGPIEWDATRNAYVQHIGQWTWSGSAWTFARKQQSGGSDYPPAAIYPVTAADLLIRGRGGSSGTVLTDDIKTLRFNLPFAAATATNWLSKQETTVSNGVTYEPPEDAGGNGQLKTGTFTLTYWSDTTPGRPSNSTLLYTVVETANATSTYEG